MKNILLASVAFLGLTGAALAGGSPSNSNLINVGGDWDKQTSTTVYNSNISNNASDVHSTTITDAFKTSRDNYNGIGTYTSAQHGGLIDAKTSGNAVGGAVQLNSASANAGGIQGSVDLTASLNGQAGLSAALGNFPALNADANALGSLQVGVAATGLAANSSSVSGSLAVGGATGNSSSVVNTAGMASSSGQAYREWGNSVTNIGQHDTTYSNTYHNDSTTTYTPVTVTTGHSGGPF